MEKAIAIESLSQLEKPFKAGFSRLYFGAETCETKIPSVQEVKKAKSFCKKHGLAFSLVSPFCTDSGLKKLQSLFPLLG